MDYVQLATATAWCDFNMITDGGFVPFDGADVVGLLPGVGDWVTLQDEDGNRCTAIVSEIHGTILYACLLRDTWETAPHLEGLTEHVMYSPTAVTSADRDTPAQHNSQPSIRHSAFSVHI